jgi:hypothetical protein
MKLLKKLINIICTVVSLSFAAIALWFLGFVWYSAAIKRAAEIGWAAMMMDGLKVGGGFFVVCLVVFAVGFVWDWSRRD